MTPMTSLSAARAGRGRKRPRAPTAPAIPSVLRASRRLPRPVMSSMSVLLGESALPRKRPVASYASRAPRPPARQACVPTRMYPEAGRPRPALFLSRSGASAQPLSAGPGAGDRPDSAITETAGLGGFAMAAAPAIVQFVGGVPADALRYTQLMYEITLAESAAYRIPALGFRGTPTGIDVRLVLQTGILPQINTGIAHRAPGVGQIGAGLVTPPRECFEAAGRALAAALPAPGA